ncbi:MAG: S8 family serine peptidase, partial [Actinomycetota bacterium]
MTKLRGLAAVSVAALALSVAPVSAATSDPYRAQQWGLDRIQAEQAWPVSTGVGATVAVVDTGVDLSHPDLAANIVSYPDADMVEPNGTCTKAPGKNGARTCTQDGAQDKNGHGTHVAGIVAAVTNNGVGVAGVAPGAKVLPVRVLDAEGSGTTDQIASGIRYAADKGAKVINLSLGFLSGVGEVVRVTGGLNPVYSAIDYAWSKGAVIVFAAGNDSVPLCAEPAAHPKVLCVGSTNRNDVRSWFSNGDATLTKYYVMAPGGEALTCAGDILSTYLRGAATYCAEDGYEALAGPSMA